MRPGALRAATARAAACLGSTRTRLTAGEKPNRKRMATLIAVYDVEPAKRRPHRAPADLIRAEAGRRPVTIHVVIDLIHVQYIWKAAWSLHETGDPPRTGSRPRHSRYRPATAAGPRRRSPDRPAPSACAAASETARDACVRYLNTRHEIAALRPGPRGRLAHHDRRYRGSMPPPHRRPPRHRRGQMRPGRRRSRPHPARRHQQRRLPGVLAIPPRPRTPADLPRHYAGAIHTRRLTGNLTRKELHPSKFRCLRSRGCRKGRRRTAGGVRCSR
jgi:hypothetical protein